MGVVFESSLLQRSELGPPLGGQLSYGLSCAKRTGCVVLEGMIPDSIPLSHLSVFWNVCHVSYEHPYLILCGVVSLGSLKRSPKYVQRIGTTLRSKYRLAMCGRFSEGGVLLVSGVGRL